jgi:hypothetical protein
MEAITKTGDFSAKDLREINRCRIYLQVFYISDISTFNGQDIAAWARKEREGKMEGGSRPGHGQFNNGQPLGKHENWHSNT